MRQTRVKKDHPDGAVFDSCVREVRCWTADLWLAEVEPRSESRPTVSGRSITSSTRTSRDRLRLAAGTRRCWHDRGSQKRAASCKNLSCTIISHCSKIFAILRHSLTTSQTGSLWSVQVMGTRPGPPVARPRPRHQRALALHLHALPPKLSWHGRCRPGPWRSTAPRPPVWPPLP